jgi:hypothetical protein
MGISISCACGKRLNAKAELAGKRVKCPGCGAVLQVPSSAKATEGKPVPAAPRTAPPGELEFAPAAAPSKEEIRFIEPRPPERADSDEPPALQKMVLIPLSLAVTAFLVIVILKGIIVGGAEKAAEGLPSATVAMAIASGRAVLEVDNQTPLQWTVEVDTRRLDNVPGYKIGRFELDAGKHTVRLVGQAGGTENLELKLQSGKVTIVNPLAKGVYLRTSPSACEPSAAPPSGEVVRGEKVIVDDVGLTPPAKGEKRPDKVLLRQPPATFEDPREPVMYLEAPREIYVFNLQSLMKAIEAVRQKYHQVVCIGALHKCIDSGPGPVVAAAFAILNEMNPDIHPDKYREWLKRPHVPAIDGDFPVAYHAAMNLLKIRGHEGVEFVQEIYDGLPAANRLAIVESSVAAHPTHHMRIVAVALKSGAAPRIPELALKIIERKDLDVEHAFAVAVDNHIDKLAGAEKEVWDAAWARKLAAQPEKLDEDYVGPRLAGYAAAGQARPETLHALVRINAKARLSSLAAKDPKIVEALKELLARETHATYKQILQGLVK